MIAYPYIRVSGAGQVEQDGPQRQRDFIFKFCTQHSLLHDGEYFDRGVSGTTNLFDRPALLELFARVAELPEPKNVCLVVERMDRLARDLMEQEVILKECKQAGIKVYAADQGALIDMASDDGDPTRKLIRQVLGALAEWEKSALVMKLRKARDRKRKETGRCEGPLPYGKFPGEEVVLERIRFLARCGNSVRAIAMLLNEGNIPSRLGRSWTASSVAKILSRDKD